jgi:hypothetical protein
LRRRWRGNDITGRSVFGYNRAAGNGNGPVVGHYGTTLSRTSRKLDKPAFR